MFNIVRTKQILMWCLAGSLTIFSAAVISDDSDEQKITIIHIGDFHGQLEPVPNTRSDNTTGGYEGGLARVMTKVEELRKKADKKDRTHFTLMVGDTTHGAAEVTFTEGDAMIAILNLMDIDLFAPGNWDYVYGTCRSNEMWGYNADAMAMLNAKPQLSCTIPTMPGRLRANFKSIAANAYVDDNRNSANCPAVGSRTRVMDAYQILNDPKTGLNIGVIGFTTERGPRVVGHPVVEGVCFTKGDQEIVELVQLMNDKRAAGEVDAVVMISELNLANNLRVIELVDATLGPGGVDIVLSADMHEETPAPIYSSFGTPLVAQGQDGQNIGEIKLKFVNGTLARVKYKQHRIDENVDEDHDIKDMVDAARAPFVDGTATNTHFVHGRSLPRDIADPSKGFGIDTPLAIAGADMNRSNFMHEKDAAIYEGSGHKMITDGMRETTLALVKLKMAAGDLNIGGNAADLCESHDAAGLCTGHLPVISVIRGFRYSTADSKGDPLTLETLYHYTPIGPYVAAGVVTGAQIRGKGVVGNGSKNAGGIEHSAISALRPEIGKWGGGWLFNWSGLKYQLNPYAAQDNYSFNPATGTESIMVGTESEGFTPLDDAKNYIVVGYNFDKTLFGIVSPAPELQFINKPFKTRFVTPNIYRVTYATNAKSTLDPSNTLDLVASDFKALAGAPNSIPVVDLVARYVMSYNSAGKSFNLIKPAQRVTVLCAQPDMTDVVNTQNGIVLDPVNPIVDIGFPMMQSIFGANINLTQYLTDTQLATCASNGITF